VHHDGFVRVPCWMVIFQGGGHPRLGTYWRQVIYGRCWSMIAVAVAIRRSKPGPVYLFRTVRKVLPRNERHHLQCDHALLLFLCRNCRVAPGRSSPMIGSDEAGLNTGAADAGPCLLRRILANEKSSPRSPKRFHILAELPKCSANISSCKGVLRKSLHVVVRKPLILSGF
jgi:hypothetical protein